VGLYWIGNMINGAPVDRARHRQLISWTLNCPECGQPCLVDLYPSRLGGTPCRHNATFVNEIGVEEVVRECMAILEGGARISEGSARISEGGARISEGGARS